MQSNFYTVHSQAVVYHSQVLDSLLELKFVLSIEQTHAWLRRGLEIYYNINDIPAGLDAPLKRYTPDILIRNWETGKATLVEIKPDQYDDFYLIRKRADIARAFITEFAYDWDYQLIRASDIQLSLQQAAKFKRILKTINQPFPLWFGDSNQNTTGWSDEQYECYVRTGWSPAPVH